MLISGFDGQTTTMRKAGSASAARKSGCARAAEAPAKAISRMIGAHCRRTK